MKASTVCLWAGIVFGGAAIGLAVFNAYQWLRANPMYVHYVVLIGLVILFAVLGVLLMPAPPKPSNPTYRKGRDE
jgi:predicted phage tail protein